MAGGGTPRWTIASYVAPRAFAPGARPALSALGYRIVSVRGRAGGPWTPDLAVVDEGQLEEIPSTGGPPLVVLTGRRGRAHRHPRVVGAAPAPAEVGALYPLLQRALEDTPRAAARVPTRIPGRCTRDDRHWTGAMLDLSEEGCLLRTSEAIRPGTEFDLLFPLPLVRMIATRARAVRRMGDRFGVVFRDLAPRSRHAIREYVTRQLVDLAAAGA